MKKTIIVLLIISATITKAYNSLVYAYTNKPGSSYDTNVSQASAQCPGNTNYFETAQDCNSLCYSQGVKGSCVGANNNCCFLQQAPSNTHTDEPSFDSTSEPVVEPVTQETLDALNPLRREGSPYADQLSTPGGIITRLLGKFAFPLGGLILFVMLVWGGFEMLSGAATQKSVDAGKQRVTAALIGFLLLFASYWIAQILEAVFGIKIL